MGASLGTLPPGFRFYKDLIRQFAEIHGHAPALVAAICWQESEFQADGFRFEPDFWNRYLKMKAEYKHLNPRRVSSSYGLMQPMYCLVLEDQLASNDALPPEHLFVPEMNLDTGCRHLAKLFAWAKGLNVDAERTLHAAVASYNGGRGGNDPRKNWPLRNGKYAREVLARVPTLEKAYAG